MYRTIMQSIELHIDQVYFWTDSMLTLQYICNEKVRFKTFVANPVTEILDSTNREQWNHVPGNINPADIVTRGVAKPGKLMQVDNLGTSWFHGPAFLVDNISWPEHDIKSSGELLNDPEVNNRSVLLTFGVHTTSNDKLIEYDRFSKWIRLQRTVGWTMRFISNTRKIFETGQLDNCEIDCATKIIVKHVQAEMFNEEILAIKSCEQVSDRAMSVLTPILDQDGILRVYGRLRKMEIADKVKHPIIMLKIHHVTDLLVKHFHEKNGHVGVEHTLAEIRQEYWIMQGRATVKRVIRKCFFCKVRRAKYMYPFMADLPSGRLAVEKPPFNQTGVDLFGPVYIKQGRKRLKRWVALFTCLTVRGVHLEVVENPDTDAFINALRRFTSRRGCPEVLYSDNGTNFVGASNELREFRENIDSKIVEEFCTKINIKWKFNPPQAPHMGGIWERMVRSTKEVLSGLMADHVLTDAQLYTFLTEVESILNSRPLTHVSDDPNDLEPLTPNHLLLGMHKNWQFVASVDDKEVSSRRKWRQVQALARTFWERWRKEYLPKITKRHKWSSQLDVKNLEVGELVLLDDDETKKKTWNLARVTKLTPSDDGVVRQVVVRTKKGEYTRPVTKIGRLEGN